MYSLTHESDQFEAILRYGLRKPYNRMETVLTFPIKRNTLRVIEIVA